jgi:hypothetical protein
VAGVRRGWFLGLWQYKVGTDNIITEATNRLSTRLKSKYGEDSVVLVTKNKDGSLAIQGDTSKVKDNYESMLLRLLIFTDSLFNAFLKSSASFAPQVPEAAPQQFNSKTLASFA